MPRVPRGEQLADGLAHVGARGTRRQELFLAERDYRQYLRLLGEALGRFRVRCHGYCLMPNHVHLLLDGPQEAISAAIHRAHGRYAQWFNRAYGLRGHAFENRFWSEAVEAETHLLELARYIANNPVRARLVARASEWPWSSIRALLGKVPPPRFLTTSWILAQFGRDATAARAALRRFVAEPVWRPPPRLRARRPRPRVG